MPHLGYHLTQSRYVGQICLAFTYIYGWSDRHSRSIRLLTALTSWLDDGSLPHLQSDRRDRARTMSDDKHQVITIEKGDVVQVEEEGEIHQLPAEEVHRLAELLDQARRATESEHKMTVWQAVKRYPKASAWSIAISFGVVMEGEFPSSIPYSDSETSADSSSPQVSTSSFWATFTPIPSFKRPLADCSRMGRIRSLRHGRLDWETHPLSGPSSVCSSVFPVLFSMKHSRLT